MYGWEDLPIDLLRDLVSKYPPSEIEKINALCRTNKTMARICKSNEFWKLYYHRYVDKKFATEPEWAERGEWKKAFQRNYSYKVMYENRDNVKYRFWTLNMSRGSEKILRNGYYDLSTTGARRVLVPVIHPEAFVYGLIYLNNEDGIMNGKSIGFVEDVQRYELLAISTSKLMLVYPFHHRLVFDNGKMPNVKHEDFKELYEEKIDTWITNHSCDTLDKIFIPGTEILKHFDYITLTTF